MNKAAHSIVIGTVMGTTDTVRLGYDALTSHVHYLARTGAGKTTLMKLIFQQVVSAGQGCLFMTPAPDAIWEAIALVPQARLADVILIDPGDDQYPFAANQLAQPDSQDAQAVKRSVSAAVNRMMRVCKKIWGPGSTDSSWGPQLENVLRNCLYALVLTNPKLTIAELPYLLRDREFRERALAGIPVVLRSAFPWTPWFWTEDFARWPERLQIERTDSTLNKVLDFLENPLIENIVGQRANTLDLKNWINQDRIILIRLSENIEGLGDEAVKLLGTLFMAQLKEAVFAREHILDKNTRKFFPVLCDEFQLFAGEDFKTLLDRGRALNVPFLICHQYMAQLYSESLREAVNQTAIKITGQVTEQDAGSFAPLYAPEPKAEQIEEKKTQDIAGYRPVLTYKHGVIGHLLSGAAYHKDERVTAFSNEYLRALNYAKEQRVREHQVKTLLGQEYVTVLPTRLGFAYDPLEIPPLMDILDDWLYAGMRDSAALWQPLPAATLGWLARFFGFGQLVEIFSFQATGGGSYTLPWYRDVKSLVPSFERLPAERQREALFDRQAFIRAVIAVVEASLIDVVAVRRPKPDVKRAWQQKAIALAVENMFDIKTRGLDALERITGSLRSLAVEQPAIDAATYERYFLAQLSKPELALDVFLPLVVHAACEMSPSIDSYIVSRDVPAISNGTVQMEHKWPSYDLGLYTLALYRGITAKLPSYLGHLTAFLRFIALLYCAQLALNQHPLYTMDSGEYEPNVHTSTHFLTTPRQSPAEVEGLMKQELINLDPFTAWCRVQNLAAPPGEKIRKYKIEIPNPQPLVTGKALTQRIEAVRQQSRRLIAPRPASVVAADIRGRVALLRQPAAPHARAADALPGAQIPPVPEEGKQPPKRPRMGEA